MPTIAHYEVYTLEDTGWVLHARYVTAEKTRALEEASALEAHLGRPTKVMRESYDTDTNRYGEQTVYLSPKAVDLRRNQRARRDRTLARRRGTRASLGDDLGDSEWGRPTASSGPVGAGYRPNARIPAGLSQFAGPGNAQAGRTRFGAPTHARSTGDLLARLLFVLVASLIIATAGAAVLPVVINMLRSFDVVVDSRSLSNSLFSVFMVLFLLSGFVLTLRLVPLQGVAGEDQPRRRRRAPGGARVPGHAAPPGAADAAGTVLGAPTETETTSADRTVVEDRAGQEAAETPDDRSPPPATDGDIDKKRKRKIQDEEEKERKRLKKELEDQKKKQKEKDQKSEQILAEMDLTDDPYDESMDELTLDPPPSRAFETGHALTVDFLGTYVAALKDLRPKLDTFNRFGINLYLAGVCDVVSQTAHLSQEEFHKLLRETVEVMGTRPELANSFVERLDTYLAEDRYARMVRFGREAMTLHQSGADNAFASLGMVLEDWNTPKTQTITGSTIAIVFTDMVGSTDLTSEHGDLKAQQTLRAHNAAVRSALARFNGREIKHTGDGIMATFEHVPDAVWGMIDVLKAARVHNQAESELPLRIRIGINAGEPISAENDYYGLAVTVAARVCAQADMDEIMVSQIVRDMCEGTKLVFEERGTTFLKGIKDPQRLHEAVWEGSPSRQRRAGSAADAPPADGTAPATGAPPPGPADDGTAETALTAVPSQPGAGQVHDGGATIDPEADGWQEPRLDPDPASGPRAAADPRSDPRSDSGPEVRRASDSDGGPAPDARGETGDTTRADIGGDAGSDAPSDVVDRTPARDGGAPGSAAPPDTTATAPTTESSTTESSTTGRPASA
ncbi:adenylate/guanylate cyclase domain-containing protein [Roseospira visakhapatnamensis]|uniref:Adenylate cyclase n=1 Tax=Roseospira visakhapatnamensis TaxID=390880 RepID=A0A7W6R9Y6_9PROT|nr:adenylate/guanylate cyclase domain-containing protein [Roseospira visakhapatnamensis]MBB4264510.1 adenylate cyclase [Roseospira visakhapatnamensis]